MRNAILAIAGLLLGTVIAQANDLEPGSPVQRLGIKTGFKNDTMWNHKLTKLKFDFVEKSKG